LNLLLKTSVIYEPQGKAREYSKLAVNLYSGCSHACEYCYSPSYIHVPKEEFQQPKPRNDILQKIIKDANRLKQQRETGPVLLCFTCDPYQPIDGEYQLTRQVIQALHSFGINVMILTKGGQRAARDFDLLTDKDWFGVSLTNLDDALSLKWEPGAALPEERIQTLQNAHEKGIKTWVSLEPVLYPDVTLEIIRQTHSFIDNFKVGTLNYHPHAKSIDWCKFARDVKNLLVELKCDFYLKDDLKKWL
jgi:DNA repair photolyase